MIEKNDLNKALIVFDKKKNLKREDGAPERIRTFDRSVRSRVLYPAELRVRSDVLFFVTILTDRVDLKWRTREDSNL